MKTIKILLVLILFSSCVKMQYEVKADFEVVKPLQINQVITFINKSDFADSYEWDFGDGTISNKRNPEKIYVKDSKYTVTLKAFQNNKVDIIQKDIMVFL